MDEAELNIRIEAANNMMLPEVDETPSQTPSTADYYQQGVRERNRAQGKDHYGSRPYSKQILKHLKASPVNEGYKKAKHDIEYLKSIGDNQRAEMVRQQYMEDYYMPAVDAAIRLGSKQDVLGSQDIIDTLDGLVILDGVRPNGYTASFVENLYEDTNSPTQSDIEVQKAVEKITRLCNEGNISGAIGAAQRIKNQIDNGNNVAIPEDYELIQKVVIRGEA